MKRHKYFFPNLLLKYTTTKERRLLLLKYIKTQRQSKKLAVGGAGLILYHFFPRSKVQLYCLVTGRIRSSLSITNTSRHIFFERTVNSLNTGFMMSSW